MEIEDRKKMDSLMLKARSRGLRDSEKQELNTLHKEYMRWLTKNPIPKVTTGKTDKNRGHRRKFIIERI